MSATLRHRLAPARKGKQESTDQFWKLAHELYSQTESGRLDAITSGFETRWLKAVKVTFDINTRLLAVLVNTSVSTIDRAVKKGEVLGPVASERIDRLAQVAVLAESVFEDKEVASKWMSTPNDALGGASPLALCSTELGARQVRRVLHAIEWGGVA